FAVDAPTRPIRVAQRRTVGGADVAACAAQRSRTGEASICTPRTSGPFDVGPLAPAFGSFMASKVTRVWIASAPVKSPGMYWSRHSVHWPRTRPRTSRTTAESEPTSASAWSAVIVEVVSRATELDSAMPNRSYGAYASERGASP